MEEGEKGAYGRLFPESALEIAKAFPAQRPAEGAALPVAAGVMFEVREEK